MTSKHSRSSRSVAAGIALFSAVAIGAFASPVAAAPLVYEGFDYALNDGLEGKSGGVGFDDVWIQRPYDSSNDATIIAGLTFSDYAVSGNAAMLSVDDTTSTSKLQRDLASVFGSAPQTVWSSYLVSVTDVGWAYAGMSTANYQWSGGGVGNDSRFSTSIRSGGNNFGVASGETYMLIGKFEGGVEVTTWVLSETEYDAIKAGGITESELDATNFDTATWSLGETDPDVLQEYLLISLYSDAAAWSVTFDELKFGATLDGVLTSVPEPASLVLITLGVGLVLSRRRG